MGTLSDTASPTAPNPRRARMGRGILIAVLALTAACLGVPPLFSWQRMGQQRAESLSNVRRLAFGLLLYSQDWDGRLPAPALRQADGSWRTWPEAVRPYVAPPSVFSNPANPVPPAGPTPHPPADGYPVTTSYALNRRFWDTFAPGPFPLENLELAEQTVLLVEAGPMWRSPRRAPSRPADRSASALLDYGDTLDRIAGFCPYPSTHDGRMAVAAADGHAVLVTVEHYTPADGPHDRLYGHLGGNLYNWNGGHPNGETDRPARE